MTMQIPVHVWLPGQVDAVRAGDFVHEPNQRSGRFLYAQSYLDARHPPLAPDMPLRAKPILVTGGLAIFPLFMDAGPDAWGRHLLARRQERDISEIEALTLCPTDGVGNIALGELTPERLRVVSINEFLSIVEEVGAGETATTLVEEQVLDAVRNGTSLGGTKPKLTLSRAGVQYLAKFPEPGDNPWLPHIECAMLKLAAACGLRVSRAEVWRLPGGKRTALLVERFDRRTLVTGVTRLGYVSAHAVLRLDLMPPSPAETLQFGTLGYTASGLRKSYVSLAAAMARWCGGQALHREERRELWRRIVFNALIRNLDDHTKNHGLLCDDMATQRWRLAPAFDLVPGANAGEQAALAMAYRFVPPQRKGRQSSASRLVTRISQVDLLAAAVEHYGYAEQEATDYLRDITAQVSEKWRRFMVEEGMPQEEIERQARAFMIAL
ncbi:MAG: type II toxin-antitoxin system HipA family toxin [Rhodocyclaceae bacterium]|nr:type II toxin-antitoxin system HipA family toxin [Rhodocyclaceae bacterium]MDZ4215101.1 type II toxin-antitoxin system HipA family toxin [Rhodocyclaceae bacterium]